MSYVARRAYNIVSLILPFPPFATSVRTVHTKLMCFTRSTPNIHRLPAVYPALPSAAEHKLSHESLMKDMITDEVNTVGCFISQSWASVPIICSSHGQRCFCVPVCLRIRLRTRFYAYSLGSHSPPPSCSFPPYTFASCPISSRSRPSRYIFSLSWKEKRKQSWS